MPPKKKNQKDLDQENAGGHTNWIRSGGAVGSEEMHLMREYNTNGAGVDFKIKSVGADPNDGVSLGHQDGSEL